MDTSCSCHFLCCVSTSLTSLCLAPPAQWTASFDQVVTWAWLLHFEEEGEGSQVAPGLLDVQLALAELKKTHGEHLQGAAARVNCLVSCVFCHTALRA